MFECLGNRRCGLVGVDLALLSVCVTWVDSEVLKTHTMLSLYSPSCSLRATD